MIRKYKVQLPSLSKKKRKVSSSEPANLELELAKSKQLSNKSYPPISP